MRKILALLACSLFVPGLAQAKTLEELLVEKGVITPGEARASSQMDGAKVYWKGGTRLEFPDQGFDVKINSQLQTRYEYNDVDFEEETSGVRIRRARLQTSGHVLNKEFEYRLQADFVGSKNGDSRSPDLRDAFFKWHFCDWGNVQMGQFKALISRQENTSSSSLQFPDRSETSEYFAISRDLGAGLNLNSPDGKFSLSGQILNGESDGEGRNRAATDTHHTGVVAARANLWGEMNPFEEGDIDHTDGVAVNVGGAYSYSDAQNDVGAGLADSEIQRVSVDANVKASGASLHTEFFYMNLKNDSLAEDAQPLGFYAQFGYFVNEKTEIAARAAYTDCDDGLAGGVCSGLKDFSEASVSLNYYFWKHALKAQLAYDFLTDNVVDGNGEDVDYNRVIFQLSAYL